jgi:Zn-dependent protease
MTIGRIAGVAVRLHVSWFLLPLVVTPYLTFRLHSIHPDWPFATRAAMAAAIGTLCLLALVLHELSHALVARRHRLPVGGITLFALGGVTHIEREPETARGELLVGIVGPATSAAIGLACALAARLLSAFEIATGILSCLAWFNLAIAAFNMIPGFPLDGGRVFRALVWAMTRDERRASRIAARTGQATGLLCIAHGLYQLAAVKEPAGLGLVAVGAFLVVTATATWRREQALARLRGASATELTQQGAAVVPSTATLSELVFGPMLTTGRRSFFAAEGDRIVGVVTLADVQAVPQDLWSETRLTRIMRAVDVRPPVSAPAPLSRVTAVPSVVFAAVVPWSPKA